MKISLHAFCKEHNLPKSTAHRRCQELRIDTADGLTPQDCDRLITAMGKTPVVKVEVESGNHQIVLATPELPEAYSLETLRQSEAVGFEDPLAIAQQFLAIADQVQTAMQTDIEKREQKLHQTQQAKQKIATKAQELRLDQRFYQERTRNLDTALSAETQELQTAFADLQKLGKSSAGEAAG